MHFDGEGYRQLCLKLIINLWTSVNVGLVLLRDGITELHIGPILQNVQNYLAECQILFISFLLYSFSWCDPSGTIRRSRASRQLKVATSVLDTPRKQAKKMHISRKISLTAEVYSGVYKYEFKQC
jgi:hypothetical protein